jgi:hypothetical protein
MMLRYARKLGMRVGIRAMTTVKRVGMTSRIARAVTRTAIHI